MKDLGKRLATLEHQARFSKNQVCVLGPTESGEWRMHLNGRNKLYPSKEAALADYHARTGPESVLIVWDV